MSGWPRLQVGEESFEPGQWLPPGLKPDDPAAKGFVGKWFGNTVLRNDAANQISPHPDHRQVFEERLDQLHEIGESAFLERQRWIQPGRSRRDRGTRTTGWRALRDRAAEVDPGLARRGLRGGRFRRRGGAQNN